MEFIKKQSKTFWLLAAFSFFVSFGRSVLPTHLAAEGLSYFQILFGSFLLILGQLIFIVFLSTREKTYRAKIAWAAGILLYVSFFLLSGLKIYSSEQYYIGTLLAGIGSVVFYLFYNLAYFSESKKEKLYTRSANFFNILLGVSIVVPFISGAVATLGFTWIVVLSVLFTVLALFIVRKQEDLRYKISLKESIRALGKARDVIFLNGVYDSLNWGIISIITLTFIKDPLEFGSFISYLAIVSLISNTIISRLGERYKKGHVVAAISSISVALIVIAMGFSQENLLVWAIINSILQLISPIFSSSVLALSLDRSDDQIAVLPAREILMNAGRFTGLAVACLLFYFGSAPWLIFLVPAGAAFVLGMRALKF